jgi:hypothetical protein
MAKTPEERKNLLKRLVNWYKLSPNLLDRLSQYGIVDLIEKDPKLFFQELQAFIDDNEFSEEEVASLSLLGHMEQKAGKTAGRLGDERQQAIKECAQEIYRLLSDFYRTTYPEEKYGIPLSGRMKYFHKYIEDRDDKSSFSLIRERRIIREIRKRLERGDIKEVVEYAQESGNSATGGYFYESDFGFDNETILNHLYVIARGLFQGIPKRGISPVYQDMIKTAQDIQARGLEIREEIEQDEELKKRKGSGVEQGFRTVDSAEAHAEETARTKKKENILEEAYTIAEFKKKDQIIQLLDDMEALYSEAIALVEAVLELDEKNKII